MEVPQWADMKNGYYVDGDLVLILILMEVPQWVKTSATELVQKFLS